MTFEQLSAGRALHRYLDLRFAANTPRLCIAVGALLLFACASDSSDAETPAHIQAASPTTAIRTQPSTIAAAGTGMGNGAGTVATAPAPAGPGSDEATATPGAMEPAPPAAADVPQAASPASGDNPMMAAGAGAAGMAPAATMGGGPKADDVVTSTDPNIPEISGECPEFATGSFSYMGLTGEMDAGAKADGDASLVFYWHGTGGRAAGFRGLGSNVQRIIAAGGIVFAVQGATGSGDRSCSGTAVFDGDFSVIDQVVACAVRDHNINPRRIYATGCSAGGLQAGCMGARRSSYVAAVAPNSGGLVVPMALEDPSHGPASFAMHGGAGDTVQGLNFGDSTRTWNSAVTMAGGFAVECNHGMGHCRAPGPLQEAAFDFLLAHPFGVEESPYASGLPADLPDYCEIAQ